MIRSTVRSSLVGAALLLLAPVTASGDSGIEDANVPPFDRRVAATNRQLVPGGGALLMRRFSNPATMNAAGTVAFMAEISFIDRQGIFVADENGPVPVVIACNSPGCGDPTPIGGTFSRFFESEHLPLSINDAGDVLFLADVTGGSVERGLFLYEGGTGAVVKVAAVGDMSPDGDPLTAIGLGALNNSGDVVFPAEFGSWDRIVLLRWKAGALSKLAKVGDPAPGGGTYFDLAGTRIFRPPGAIPATPPALNDAGDVVFRGAVLDGVVSEDRVILSTAGTFQVCLSYLDPAPGGGEFWNIGRPIINNRGEIAFLALVTPEVPTVAAFFRGLPGDLHRAISYSDPLDGGEILEFGGCRSPYRTLDDCGNLAGWARIRYPGAIEREVIFIDNADGPNVVIAREGDPTGQENDAFTCLFTVPVMNNAGQVLFSAGDTGVSEYDRYSHHVFTSSRPSPIDGIVNGATGPVTNVLFVNGAAGDVVVGSEAPFTISLDAAPAGPASGKYFFYVWIADSLNPAALVARGAFLGYLSNPSPFHPGESPMPFRCVRGTGLPDAVCRGLAERTGPPRAPFSIPVSGGLKNPITLRLQGVLQDAGAPNALGYSVTNSVGLAVQ